MTPPVGNTPPLYTSPRLTQLVIKWCNMQKISRKMYLTRNDNPVWKKAYAKLITLLSAQPGDFEFNNRSIMAVLQGKYST